MDRLIRRLSYWLALAAGAALIATTALMFFDAMGRYFLSAPLPFAVELVELFIGLSITFGMAYTTYERGHISVDLLPAALPPVGRRVLSTLADITAVIFMGTICWQLFKKAGSMMRDGMLTQILGLPVHPFVYVMAVAAALAAAVAVLLLLHPADRTEG
ncbi:TRAP transporter small permease [Anianabacter salinae]|uniref:TRAP transporter small permease n=1 Tax=Anianabacter salinae TaxID=2851023 RepID=UPI00225E0197|nr:TRAP transporter small permease [Anianabacter salinae]MBV0911683.1 TRAP transporter small permease [Anianabacter salinae]